MDVADEHHGLEQSQAWMYMADRAWVEEQMRDADNLLDKVRCFRTPDTPTMYAEGPDAFLRGWIPAAPLISRDTRVIAFGSCFAARFVEWLAEHGYNRAFDPVSDSSIVRSPLETPSVVAQQFRWAFGELDSELAFWMTPDRRRVEATEAERLLLRERLSQADVLIITFGLSEVWNDKESGEPIWRIPPRELLDRFAFKVETVDECVAALQTIHRIRLAHMPHLKVIYTVSPQRLAATFREMSPIVANTATKATLRAAVDEFLQAHTDELNTGYFYFPAYEIATELLRDCLFEDNLHLRDRHAALILDVFARYYTTEGSSNGHRRFPASQEEELRTTIVTLEKRATDLQKICDERLAIIEQLDRQLRAAPASSPSAAASPPEAELRRTNEMLQATLEERTAAVEGLRAQIDELDARAHVLQTACDERLVVIRQLDADRRRPFAAARAVVRRLRRGPAGRETQPPA